MNDHHELPELVASEFANQSIVSNPKFPIALQVLGVGQESLSGIVNEAKPTNSVGHALPNSWMKLLKVC